MERSRAPPSPCVGNVSCLDEERSSVGVARRGWTGRTPIVSALNQSLPSVIPNASSHFQFGVHAR